LISAFQSPSNCFFFKSTAGAAAAGAAVLTGAAVGVPVRATAADAGMNASMRISVIVNPA
jgi:hypothetical protein